LTLSRRAFIGLLVEGAAVLGGLRLISIVPPAARADLVRPPGAVEEAYFNLMCIRCGICFEACPSKTIMLAGFEKGAASVNTPMINPLIGPCEYLRGRCEDAMRCAEACPTGALQNVDKAQVKLGTAKLNQELCLAYNGRECLVCSEMCPLPDAITVTEDQKPVFHNTICTGCGACVNACPANPRALTLLSEGERRARWP